MLTIYYTIKFVKYKVNSQKISVRRRPLFVVRAVYSVLRAGDCF